MPNPSRHPAADHARDDQKEASRFTASLVKGQRVRLEIQTSPTSRDKYGRILAYVFRQSDNLLVNKEIIRQGYRSESGRKRDRSAIGNMGKQKTRLT